MSVGKCSPVVIDIPYTEGFQLCKKLVLLLHGDRRYVDATCC